MANLIPRDVWGFPSRMPSLLDDVDDFLSIVPTDMGNAISVSEDDKHIHVEAAIPGINPDDVEITYNRGMLWIHGVAREEQRNKKRKFYRRAAQEFSYRIGVPGDVDPNTTPEAECENGMIMVTLSKVASATPKKLRLRGVKITKRKS